MACNTGATHPNSCTLFLFSAVESRRTGVRAPWLLTGSDDSTRPCPRRDVRSLAAADATLDAFRARCAMVSCSCGACAVDASSVAGPAPLAGLPLGDEGAWRCGATSMVGSAGSTAGENSCSSGGEKTPAPSCRRGDASMTPSGNTGPARTPAGPCAFSPLRRPSGESSRTMVTDATVAPSMAAARKPSSAASECLRGPPLACSLDGPPSGPARRLLPLTRSSSSECVGPCSASSATSGLRELKSLRAKGRR
mmetsp:Transcript_4965/g.15824  ORF Transcript_4965/g.15824 Transcript_4965/m.15824 type:complete len:252 (-) Transcript_4965:137-892(-)